MAFIKVIGIAVVDSDPNNEAILDANHSLYKAVHINGQQEWSYNPANVSGSRWVLDSGGGTDDQNEGEVPLINDYSDQLPLTVEQETVVETGVTVDTSFITLPNVTYEDVIASINRPDETELLGKFVNANTGAIGYLNIALNAHGASNGSDIMFIIAGGSTSSSSSSSYYGNLVWLDEFGNPLVDTTGLTDPADTYQLSFDAFVEVAATTQEEYNKANREKWAGQSFGQTFNDGHERIDLNGQTLFIEDSLANAGLSNLPVATFNDGQTTLRALLMQLIGINQLQIISQGGSISLDAPLGVLFAPRNTPANPTRGIVYFDSITNKLRCYDGTGWNDLF